MSSENLWYAQCFWKPHHVRLNSHTCPPCWVTPKEKLFEALWSGGVIIHEGIRIQIRFLTISNLELFFLVDSFPFPSSAFYLLVGNVGINLLNSLVSMGVTYNDPALWISQFPIHSKTLWTTWMVIPMYNNVGTCIIYLYIHIYIFFLCINQMEANKCPPNIST